MIRRHHLGLVAALVTLAVLGSTGVATATWTATGSTTATASSAVVKPAISQTGLDVAAPQQYTTGSAPAVTGSLTLRNDGTAPLAFTLALGVTGDSTLASKTTLTLWTASSCTTTAGSDAVTTTLADASPTLPTGARSLTPGTSRTVCIATRIAGTDGSTTNAALQGRALKASFTATGSVGSWTASAAAPAFSQSVYRLSAPTGPVGCAEANRAVTLTWNAPANRPAGRTVTYRLVNTSTGSTLKTISASTASVSQVLQATDFPANGNYPLTVVASESDFGTTADAMPSFTITRTSPLGWGVLFQRLECPA